MAYCVLPTPVGVSPPQAARASPSARNDGRMNLIDDPRGISWSACAPEFSNSSLALHLHETVDRMIRGTLRFLVPIVGIMTVGLCTAQAQTIHSPYRFLDT